MDNSGKPTKEHWFIRLIQILGGIGGSINLIYWVLSTLISYYRSLSFAQSHAVFGSTEDVVLFLLALFSSFIFIRYLYSSNLFNLKHYKDFGSKHESSIYLNQIGSLIRLKWQDEIKVILLTVLITGTVYFLVPWLTIEGIQSFNRS